VLEKMKAIAQGDYIFPGGQKDRPLSNMAMAELLKGMGDWRDKHRAWVPQFVPRLGRR
jgi:hypothetical protein